MDTLGALALATEPPSDGLMNRPPVGRGVSFITNGMWRNIIGQSIYQLAVLGTFNFDGKNLLRLEGSAVMASTVTFQVIIVEFLGTFASTVPLSWQLWLLSVLLGSLSMPIAVVLKCIPIEKATPKHHDGYESLPSGPDLA
ncbi:hypothetical protein ACSBR1_034796 [Camellia fascicularis]